MFRLQVASECALVLLAHCLMNLALYSTFVESSQTKAAKSFVIRSKTSYGTKIGFLVFDSFHSQRVSYKEERTWYLHYMV